MYRVLISDKLGEPGLARLAAAEDVAFDVITGLDEAALIDIIPEYDALIIRSGTQVTAAVLTAAKKLRVVGRAGIGVDNIDIPAATRRGIIVMNTPRANAIATAEQAIGLMLAVCRHTPAAHASLLAGEWRRSQFVGSELYGKTLGIIGFGNIGRLVAVRAQAFGMDVIAYDPFVSESVGVDLGVTLVDLDDLLASADIITLHTAMTTESRGIINADTIAAMKDGAILINGARGKLVDEPALAAAIKSGKLKAAAVDVYQAEPPAVDHPLIGLPNVVHTPHLGASTVEAQTAVATEIVDQVLDALRGAGIHNAVNMPFSMGPDFAELRPCLELATRIGVLQGHLTDNPITHLEVAVRGEQADALIRPVAAALLKGVLSTLTDEPVNDISAPLIAEQYGITIEQAQDPGPGDYQNAIYTKATAGSDVRIVAGVLFGGRDPRIVQVDSYHLDANPYGTILVLQNRDVPGVIGQVGTILGAHNVNIGEWRMGRHAPGSDALSFINMDSAPSAEVLEALREIQAITNLKLIRI